MTSTPVHAVSFCTVFIDIYITCNIIDVEGGAHRLNPWQIELAPAAREFLYECHPQKDVRDRIKSRFIRIIDAMEAAGTYVGMPMVRHIRNGLWEARVDDPTGAYRLFFGIAPRGIIAIACGDVKKSDKFPKSVFDWAENEVNALVSTFTPKSQQANPRRRKK